MNKQLDLFEWVEPCPSKVIAGSRDRFIDKWRIRFVYGPDKIDRTISADVLPFRQRRLVNSAGIERDTA